MDETNNTNQWMDLPHPVLFLSVQSHLPQRDDELRVHSGQILRLLKQRSGWVEVLYRDQVGWCPLACLGDQVLDEKESALDPALKWDWVRWFLRRSQNNSHMWQQNLNEEQMDKLRLETMFRNAEETVDTCSSPVDSIQDDSSLSSPLPQGPSATGATSDASSEMLLDYILSEEAFLRELMDLMQDYQEPLLMERWLSRTDHDMLFGGVEEVYEFHKVLYTKLDGLLQVDPSERKLGHSLLDFIPVYTDIYSRYAANLPRIVTLASKYRSHPAMTSFLKFRNQSSSSSGSSLLHLLALLHKPAQRNREMLKAIQRILGVTSGWHPDREDLILAWKAARESLEVIEGSMRRSELSESVKELQGRLVDWKGPPLSNHGQILRFNLLDVKDGTAVKRLHVCALEKVLLFLKTKPRSRTKRGSSEQQQQDESASDSPLTLVKKIPLTSACIRAVATWSVRDDKTFRIVYTTEKGSTTFIEVTALNKASCELWIATIRGAIQKNDGIPESPMTMLRKVMRLRESHPTSSPEAGALFKSESWTSSTSTIAVKTDSGSESGKPQKPSLPFDPTSLRSRSVRSHSNATDSFTSDSSGTMVNWKGSTATSSSKNRSSSLMSPPLSPESSPSQIKTQLYRGKTDDTAETAVNEPMAQSAKNLLDDFKMTPGMKITKAEYDELQAAYASKVAECRDMYQCLSVFSTRPASALTRDAEAQTSEELVDSSWDETLSIIEGYF